MHCNVKREDRKHKKKSGPRRILFCATVLRAVATWHIPRRLALDVSLTKSLGYNNDTLIQRAGVGGNGSNNGHVRCWNH